MRVTVMPQCRGSSAFHAAAEEVSEGLWQAHGGRGGKTDNWPNAQFC